jgi:WD40 repeat protein
MRLLENLCGRSSDESIKLWNVQERTEQQHLIGHKSGVTAIAFGPDNKLLVNAARNDPARVWNLKAKP